MIYLKNSKVTPLKKFGQNFLRDKNIIGKITAEIAPATGEHILEIGPGTGALTGPLLASGAEVTAVEIDRRAAECLRAELPALKLIEGDILKTPLAGIAAGNKLRVAGNIPYNITSPILFKLLAERTIISDAVLMMQDEVARRLTAPPGGKDYGVLSIILGSFAEIRYCFKISPNVFYPKPAVNSALVHLRFTKEPDGLLDEQLFKQTVKAAFTTRRKTLRNSLSHSPLREYNPEGCGLNLELRPEQLPPEAYVQLANYFWNQQQRLNEEHN